MRLRVDEFRGTAPKFQPNQLADGLAVTALNARSGRGLLEPWASASSTGVTLPANSNYWFRYLDTYWFTWQNRTEAVKMPLINDGFNYIGITDTSYPKITRSDVALAASPYPATTYRIGVPQLNTPSIAVATNSATRPATPSSTNDLDLFTVYYKVALVDAWGREGPGSMVSMPADLQEYTVDGTVYMAKQVTLTRPALPSGSYNLGSGALWRIYRANYTSSGGGVFQFLAEVPIATTSYIDRVPSSQLGEEMITDDWFGPPDDNTGLYPNGPLRHIGAHPSGFMFGHTKHEVAFSEPGTTHAWPVKYQQSVREEIVTCLLTGGDIVVLTKGVPYVFNGLSPAAMSPIRIPEPFPCMSQDAVVEVNGVVFYASKNGMVAVNGSSAQIVTAGFYRDVDWRALNPASMRFGQYDDKVFIFRAGLPTLIFDPVNPDDGLRQVDLNPTVFTTEEGSGDFLYVASGDATRTVKKFNDVLNTPLSLTYRSKEYRLPAATAFAYVKVVSDSYPFNLTVYARKGNGAVVSHTRSVTNDNPFALPGGFLADAWWFEVTGTPQIHSVVLAHSKSEVND